MYTNMTSNLMVNSVDETVTFYQNVLGFSLFDSVRDDKGELQFAIMGRDGLTLMFQEKNNLMSEYPPLKREGLSPSITLYIMVDDFENTYQLLKEKWKILVEVHETFYGAKEFAIEDNSGYILTFTENRDV